MKKILYTMMAFAIATFALTSCEDVPSPYDIPEQEDPIPDTPSADVLGSGTLADPYNVAAANEMCASLEQSSTSASYLSDSVYVKGIICKISDTELSSYGNITYYISDDGTETDELEVYRGFSFNGAEFTSLTDINVGDTVIVNGLLQNWLGTYEFTSKSKICYLNGKTSAPESSNDNPSGTNLLVNGDFETWADGLAINWKSTSTASNATVTQGTEAHGGSYSAAVAAGGTSNKRLAYKEITLKAGTYTFSVYAKASTSDASQTEIGYVPVTDGTVGSYNYKSGYVSLNNSSWTQVTATFTLDAQTTVCLVVMNPKTSNYATSQTIYIDDATLTTSDGGIVESSSDSGNSGSGDSGAASGAGSSADNPYTVAQAIQFTSALASGASSSSEIYVSGKVSKIVKLGTSGQLMYYISDDGTETNQMEIYYGNYLGNTTFTSVDQIKVGDAVIVCGTVTNYKGTTPEFASGKSYIYSLNGSTSASAKRAHIRRK